VSQNSLQESLRSTRGGAKVTVTVDIADLKIATSRDEVLVTYALGSCVGLSLYDPVAMIGGMVHCQLPLSKNNPEKAAVKPNMFTDTGVTALLQSVFSLGADRSRLIAKVAGGANLLDDDGLFKIGERNYTVLRKVLWKNSILIQGEDVGGTASRTMYLHMDSGKTFLKSGGRSWEL
jgi:chemotaxis protein CheD